MVVLVRRYHLEERVSGGGTGGLKEALRGELRPPKSFPSPNATEHRSAGEEVDYAAIVREAVRTNTCAECGVDLDTVPRPRSGFCSEKHYYRFRDRRRYAENRDAALERQDVDRTRGVVRIVRTHVEGATKPYAKTSASVREVPLSARAIAALDDVPPRLDTRLVFPGPRGAHVNLRNFRRREWHPAIEAAGIEPRPLYDPRSTFASQALAAGVSVFELDASWARASA